MVLNEAASVTLGFFGEGLVTKGPTKTGTRWRIKIIATAVAGTQAKVPIFKVYLGPPSDVNLLGGSFSGTQDSTDIDVEIGPGQVITGQWLNGQPGDVATMSLYGELIAPGVS